MTAAAAAVAVFAPSPPRSLSRVTRTVTQTYTQTARRSQDGRTHRQHGRIVQSHHGIVRNNSAAAAAAPLLSSSLPLPLVCHLTSSVSLVCLADSKSPSLCPRSLRLPCQSLPPPSFPPPLLALSLSLLLAYSCPFFSSPLIFLLALL